MLTGRGTIRQVDSEQQGAISAAITGNRDVRTSLDEACRESMLAREQGELAEAARDEEKPAVKTLTEISRLSGLSAIGFGILVLIGWALGIGPLKSVMSDLETMKPITAATFILSGILLVMRCSRITSGWRKQLQTSLGIGILAIGAITLLQYTFRADLIVGHELVAAGWAPEATRPMSVPSATEFVLFAIAMLLPRRGLWSDLAFVAVTMLGMLIALLVFAGYLYDLPLLYRPLPESSIALHTAIACFVLFLGAALTRPNTGWVTLLAPGSVTSSFAPWLLPSIVILPVGLGWVLQQFIEGSIFSPALGVDVFALSSVLFLVIVVWRTGVIANRLGRHLELREQLEQTLRKARAAAEEATAAKSDFLANMTHELRTPLNSIIGFAGLLSKSRKLGAADRRYANIIDGSSRSLLALVNDILDFSSLEAGAVTLHPIAFSLRKLADEVVASVSLMAKEKNLTLKVEIGNNVGEAHFGDVTRLHQVLLNLVNNAVKFTNKGGVTLAITAAEHSDSVQHLRLEVRDTGIGIAPEKIEAMFGRFAQADASIHKKFGGSGLGLAISKHLVGLMGGKIGMEAAKDQGTTVWIELTLPCMDPEALLDDESSDVPVAGTVRRKILVVDDVDLNRDLVMALLTPHGHTIDQAASGTEAIEAVKTGNYDIVLMDVQMPEMNGMDATRAIRAMGEFRNLPIIAMTAQALASQWEACREAGMSDHLPKPITPTALLAMLSKWTGEADLEEPSDTGEREVPAELRKEFIGQCARDLTWVQHLLESQSPSAIDEVRKLAHRIAGTGAMTGFPELSRDAQALEETLTNGGKADESRCTDFLTRLKKTVLAA